MANLFTLMGTILIDNDKANESISKTEKKTEGLGSKMLGGIKTAAKWGAGLAAGAVAGATALYGVATKAAGVTDNIDKMSQKIGISRTAYQELDFVCSQSGASVDNLKAGMKTLTNQMQSAEEGSSKAQNAFNQLGIEWEDGTGKLKDQETMMWEAFEALQNMDDQTMKAALATDLFGKAGTDLMPMLNGASGSIEEMRQQAHDLGLVLDDEAIDAGVLFTDTVDQLKRSFSAVVTKIGTSVMPMFQTAMDWILDNMPLIQTIVGGVFSAIQIFVEIFVDIVGALFGKIYDNWDTIWQGLVDIWEIIGVPLFDIINEIITWFGENSDAIFNGFMTVFRGLWDLVVELWTGVGQPIFEALWEVIQTVFTAVMSIFDSTGITFSDVFGMIQSVFQIAIDILKSVWNNVGQPVFDLIMFVVNTTADVFKQYMPQISSMVKEAFDIIKNLWNNGLKPVFDAIGALIKNVLAPAFKTVFSNIIKPVVEACFKNISNLWNNSLKPIFTGITDFLGGVFTGNWKKAFSGIVNIVKGIFGGIVSVVKAPINSVIGILNGFINGINKLQVPDWVPGIGGKGINIPKIPLLAKGGVLEEGQAIVSEAGPEMVQLMNGKAVVTPLDSKARSVALGNNEESGKVEITLKIENFYNERKQDIKELVEEIMEVAEESRIRKGEVFA